VAAVRDFLGMDVAYATEFADGNQVFHHVRGDGDAIGLYEGLVIPLEKTYCQRVVAGDLPNVIPDTHAVAGTLPQAADQAANIGAFVSVPITFSDGELYGTLCAASQTAHPDLEPRDLQFLHVFARLIADQIELQRLQDRERERAIEATAAGALMVALEARDGYTGEHSDAVVTLAVAVAKRLGLDDERVAEVRQAALLHDIGKIAVPDAILNKNGPLTEAEWRVMRTHPISSEQIALGTEGLRHLAPILRAEHERWDGDGYPDRLAGDAIPLASRIVFVCDAYHAMTSDRPYRSALPAEAAAREIAAGAQSQFCPRCARALLDVLAG
jgi:response regulator RpfG family c-di-GMP phosphodiesterase